MAASNNNANLVRLVPINACTKETLSGRPILTVGPGSPTIYLGDNDSTEIVDPMLSHQVVKVYEKRGKTYAFCFHDGMGVVDLNGNTIDKGGRRELKDGDILALRSEEDDVKYSYIVQRSNNNNTPAEEEVAKIRNGCTPTNDDDNDDTTAAVAAAAAPTGTMNSLPAQVGEQAMCAICMEIMVEPRTIVPCGHSFCKSCLLNQHECAECRGPIQGQVQCRSLQNLIASLVDVSTQQGSAVSVFDKEDLESYQNRKKNVILESVLPSARKKMRLARRAAANNAARAFGANPWAVSETINLI